MGSKKVLVLGGTGYIGGTCVQGLLSAGHKVTVASRGRWSWDWAEALKPNVRFVFLDRSKPSASPDFFTLLHKERDFDAVVDFSAYKAPAVEPFFEAMAAAARLYVYISSDSVYEVSVLTGEKRPSVETDAVRPELKEDIAKMKALDSYGHHKLAVEEFLGKGSMPYVFLRLPDVLGERDSTQRLWPTLLWMRHFGLLGKPIPVAPWLVHLRTSYVYVRDVASAVRAVLAAQDQPDKLCQAYNVGTTSASLLELLGALGEGLGAAGVGEVRAMDVVQLGKAMDKWSGEFPLPSVTRGPICWDKFAKAFPDWAPTDFQEAMNSAAAFYVEAARKFPKERDEVAEDLLKDLDIDLKSDLAQEFLAIVKP